DPTLEIIETVLFLSKKGLDDDKIKPLLDKLHQLKETAPSIESKRLVIKYLFRAPAQLISPEQHSFDDLQSGITFKFLTFCLIEIFEVNIRITDPDTYIEEKLSTFQTDSCRPFEF
ncbi:hypothetical protein ACFL27_18980, partial [candidate division CSSED10-310 bacterium]